MKKYTIEEIKRWLSSMDSLGDALYYCDEKHIDFANEHIKSEKQLIKDLKEPEEEVENGSRG